jgi:RNA polymerase sigma factor (sigma-70 family)
VSAAHFERDLISLLEPLHRRAIRMTSAPADAEDLLQETVLKAYAGRRSFQPRTNLKAWLFRIMTNTYISSYRTKKRQLTSTPKVCVRLGVVVARVSWLRAADNETYTNGRKRNW